MTEPDDSHSATRPISVAELLARNGTIGAPPVGGRRRRRRGNADSVTVAELTGEIPVISERDVEQTETGSQAAVVEEDHELTRPASTNGVTGHADHVEAEPEAVDENGAAPGVRAEPVTDIDNATAEPVTDATAEVIDEPIDQPTDEVTDEPIDQASDDELDDDYAGAVADYTAHVEQRDADPDLDFFAPPRRSGYAPRSFNGAGVDAEQMSPDPVDDEDDLGSSVDVAETPEIEDEDTAAAVAADDRDELPSYLRSTQGPLFGGQTVADDLARRRARLGPEDIHLDDLESEDVEQAAAARPSAISAFLRGTWVVLQCIIAVAFGAGLFIAFDQLWKWNNIVALVLSVLVILGLVVGVRVVRKTEDIGSTLIAVAVGALVTLGPLALLQSG